MSRQGAPDLTPGAAAGLRVAVTAARWHAEVMQGLVDGAHRALRDHGVADPAVVWVPGSFELPLVARELALADHEAVVALGTVIRGGTPHFDYVCAAATDGLSRVAMDTGVPVGFGLLTCDTEQQARDRAGLPGSAEDKGYDATVAALSTAATLRAIRSGSPDSAG